MPLRFIQASPVSLTSGQATPLGTSAVICSTVFIQSDALNTGYVYMGGSSLTAANGLALSPGEKMSLGYDPVMGNNSLLTLGSIYLTTDTNGNVVRLSYWQVN